MMQPMIVENFLLEEEIQILLNASRNCNEAFAESSQSINEERWKLRAAHVHHIKKYDAAAVTCMIDIANKIQDILRTIEATTDLFVEIPQFSRWLPGDALDPPHADNCHPDGSPNTSPQRSHGAIIYLNEDFEGGELFYPNFNLVIKPKRGMLALHGADLKFLHGVKEVSHDRRHTVITFASTDHDYVRKMRYSYLYDR